jgi:hypothetical protein
MERTILWERLSEIVKEKGFVEFPKPKLWKSHYNKMIKEYQPYLFDNEKYKDPFKICLHFEDLMEITKIAILSNIESAQNLYDSDQFMQIKIEKFEEVWEACAFFREEEEDEGFGVDMYIANFHLFQKIIEFVIRCVFKRYFKDIIVEEVIFEFGVYTMIRNEPTRCIIKMVLKYK